MAGSSLFLNTVEGATFERKKVEQKRKFLIGDRISISDGSYSVLMKDGEYNIGGVYGNDAIAGCIIAVDCRLPLGPGFVSGPPSPREGVPSYVCGKIFNDLLVKTDNGFVFTSSDLVTLVEPEYAAVIYGVKIDITEEQSKKLALAIGGLPGSGVQIIK